MVEDEEARKRLFYIIAIPIGAMVILVTMIQYIFTSPVDALATYFGNDVTAVEDFMDEHGSDFDELGFWKANEHILNTDYEVGDYSNYDAFDKELFSKLMDEATKYIGVRPDRALLKVVRYYTVR